MDVDPWVIVLVLIILLFAFSSQLIYLFDSARAAVLSAVSDKKPSTFIPDESLITNPKSSYSEVRSSGGNQSAETDKKLGYNTGDMSWNETIKSTELDPATFINHQEFVKDVRRFSSGANFTSVADDNTSPVFTNFVGLRRPDAVTIGAGARQVPDIDENVLKRNKVFRWNSTS